MWVPRCPTCVYVRPKLGDYDVGHDGDDDVMTMMMRIMIMTMMERLIGALWKAFDSRHAQPTNYMWWVVGSIVFLAEDGEKRLELARTDHGSKPGIPNEHPA